MSRESDILDAMQGTAGAIVAKTVLGTVVSRGGHDLEALAPSETATFIASLEKGLAAFVPDATARSECCRRVEAALALASGPTASVEAPRPGARSAVGKPMVIKLTCEYDIVTARGQGRSACQELGFPASQQIKIATVVSELARNIIQYAGCGRIEIRTVDGGRKGIEIVASDEGNGIADLDVILSGRYKSKTGMGMGLYGTSNLMDEFEVQSAPGAGTRVMTRKYLS